MWVYLFMCVCVCVGFLHLAVSSNLYDQGTVCLTNWNPTRSCVFLFSKYANSHIIFTLISISFWYSWTNLKKEKIINWKGTHNTRNELLEEVQSVCAVLTLCIYNRYVGWAMNIYYGPRQQDSLLLAHCCLRKFRAIDCRPHAAESVLEKWAALHRG